MLKNNLLNASLRAAAPAIIVPPPRPVKAKLPNVKKLFLPDPGWVMCDADLQQADAQVVAWDSGDASLKKIFLDPDLDLHTENAKTIFGSCPTKDHPNRKRAKAGVHAVNYGVFAKTLAGTLGCTIAEAEFFISTWFKNHPDIKRWQERINKEMFGRRYVENAFGYRKTFFGDVNKGTALSEALAWIPQSTVAIVINKVWDNLNQLDPRLIRVKMQVHDSLVFQIRQGYLNEVIPQVKQAFDSVVVPYEDPLVIGSSLAIGANWGDVEDISWDGRLLDPATGRATNEYHMYMQAA